MTAPEIRIAAASATIALLLACDSESQPDLASVSTDSAGIRIVHSHPANSDATCTISAEPTVVIGDDESDENQWFAQVGDAARMSDGSIVAVDRGSNQIRVYDADGRHLRTMGRQGEGPGEFENGPFQMWIAAGDTIWAGDYFPWRYNLFGADGEFVRQVSLNPQFINSSMGGGVLANGYTVNSSETRARKPDFSVADTMIVEAHGPGGELIDTLARIPHGRWGQDDHEALGTFWLPRLFYAGAEVDAGGSTIALAYGMNTEVRVLDDEVNLRLIVRWTEPDREVTAADVDAWREEYVETRPRPDYSPMAEVHDAMISEDRPVAELFPAISTVMVGRDGRIWVREYDRPREDRGWLAFEPDGQFLCHLAPPGGSIREFGSDDVVIRQESELGVQVVQLHRLEVPVP
ncbi:MAG: hypothetical protein F4123_11585 [Gemmatimonadetes bacterium]|nr:hypothetical protein [Gemmatimonadota bacterium]MYB96992.1 hypothetical protein [Gemmatimonadota bacterium]MYI46999.1 hypothetical protein [Gemmatimonadota bacterium]